MRTVATLASSATAGVLTSVAACWPFQSGFPHGASLWWLQIVTMAWWLRRMGALAAGPLATANVFAYAFAWIFGGVHWLYISMHTYGGVPAWIAAVALLGFSAALALFYVLPLWMIRRRWNIQGYVGALWVASAWALSELARATFFSGFGWGAIGYGQVDGPLMALAPWLGGHWIGACAIWTAAKLAQVATTKSVRPLLPVTVLYGACLLIGAGDLTVGNASIQVKLLQGNIPQNEKFVPGTGVAQALKWYGQEIGDAPATLVVAPETAIPLLPQDLPGDYWEALLVRAGAQHGASLLGVPLGDASAGYTNSVVGVQGGRVLYRYDKHHLVPFGEYTPPWFRWFTRLMHIPLGDFERGASGQQSMHWMGQRLAPTVCYEDLFPEELATRFADAPNAPSIFVNVSNLGWFGDSVAMDQHLQISRMRAAEFQRPFVRAANTGITGVLDHHGVLSAAMPRLTRGSLLAVVEGRTGMTPYAWLLSHYGLWPVWLSFALLLLLAHWWHGSGHTPRRIHGLA